VSNAAVYAVCIVIVFVATTGAVAFIRGNGTSLSLKARIADAFGFELNIKSTANYKKERRRP